jgi:hypothetical protein
VSSSLTPSASVTSSTSLSVGTNTITFAATNAVAATITSIRLVSTISEADFIEVAANSWTTTGSGASASTSFSASLNAGSYKLRVHSSPNGYLAITDTLSVAFPSSFSASNQQISFNGGSFTITANRLSLSSYITVNGLRGDISSYSSSAVTYRVPALVTAATQSAFGLKEVARLSNSQFTFFSDMDATPGNVSAAFDGLTSTFYGSTNTLCWLGIDAGSGAQVLASRIRVFPNIGWLNVGKKILHATFEGSNDKASWTTLATVDQTIHSGWNVLATSGSTAFRYIRFSHNSTSQCNIAEFEIYGVLYSSVAATLASTTSDVVYHDGFNTKTFTGALEFREDKSPIVTGVSPRYGEIFGGYTLTLSGTNLDAGVATITIDGVDCPVDTASASASTITCTVAARSSTYSMDNTFTVTVGPSTAILQDTFLYVLKWSNASTWGVDMPPINNDLIYVPKGTTLFVDQSTPILEGIAV